MLHVRPFKLADAEPLRHLFRETIRAVNARDYSPPEVEAWIAASSDAKRWRTSFRGRATFVAEVEDCVAGFAELEGAGGRAGRFYVSKNHQRLGIGRALYEALENEAKRRGAAKLTVEASLTARSFFEQMGFGNARRQEVERQGVTLTNFVMEKKLKAGAA